MTDSRVRLVYLANRDAMKLLSRLVFRPGCVFCFIVVLCVFPTGSSSSDETMHPDSWVYPALRTFELLGLVCADPSLPYSRSEIEGYVNGILERIEGGDMLLTERQSFLLRKLEEEFLGKSSTPKEREDPPVYIHGDRDRFFLVDASVSGGARKVIESKKGQADGLMVPVFLADIGGRVTFETSYRWMIAPEWESNVRNGKPSGREKSWRGVTSEYERGYVSYSGSCFRLHIGRDYVHWGSGHDEGLIVSRTAGSLDQVGGRIRMGRFSLSTFHASLDPDFQRRLSAHRLAIRLPKGIYVGISETVLYTGRGFDYAYLLPVCSYYANQFNEKDDDNVLWAIDWKIPLPGKMIHYGEFLVDDFQYEGDPPAPNRLGFNLSLEALVDPFGRDVELEAGYTFIDIYVYAHKEPIRTRYVTGNADPVLNSLIGSPLGPDSDRWTLSAKTAISPRVELKLRGSIVRRGEGADLREWERGDDPDPDFPCGRIVEEREFSVQGSYDLEHGSGIETGIGWRFVSSGSGDMTEDYAYLELVVDF